ncbi:MAG: glutamine synthetase III [Christensenellaceae bacterium]|jgi:glutamine synthetase
MHKSHINVTKIFGSMVFNDSVMRERLPKHIYRSLKQTMEQGEMLDSTLAEVVASAMKDWALEKGATHYTHWFHPMTGITAEKHDSFISPLQDGRVIMEFSGKELSRGESDASSFPSGGLRATFEARGYTAWDPTSYAFIKDNTLCIPTIFCSYSGEVLDKKTPLLRSIQTLNNACLRVLHLFGDDDVARVEPSVGAEQEYFLIPKDLFKERKDLIFTGRTLFGARPPKGQELDDHYFGHIRGKVRAFMKELNIELWKLGISAKTEHNEAAPAQHELAPIYNNANIACDHNQLTMELMKKIARDLDMVCLLHAKPFAGVNGSGKHNNWSLQTDTGENLLEPGDSPVDNARFLLFLCAVIKAVDEYGDLLRASVASPDNDHRLGANEAPPAIISIFLGSDLVEVMESIETGKPLKNEAGRVIEVGVSSLPPLPIDSTDRNRTSPFAFTGNKFEFRALSAGSSIADPNIVLNTIVAEELSQFADILESAEDFNKTLTALIRETYINHKRIIFDGNNYSKEWEEEAARRGLPNLKGAVDAIPVMTAEKNMQLMQKHHIYSAAEIASREEVLIEAYTKALNIEALTAVDIARTQILPAALTYQKGLLDGLNAKKAVGIALSTDAEKEILSVLSGHINDLHNRIGLLESAIARATAKDTSLAVAQAFSGEVTDAMNALRATADALETMVDAALWPFPTYSDILYYL